MLPSSTGDRCPHTGSSAGRMDQGLTQETVDPVRVSAKGLEGCVCGFLKPPGLKQQDRRFKKKFREAAVAGEIAIDQGKHRRVPQRL